MWCIKKLDPICHNYLHLNGKYNVRSIKTTKKKKKKSNIDVEDIFVIKEVVIRTKMTEKILMLNFQKTKQNKY